MCLSTGARPSEQWTLTIKTQRGKKVSCSGPHGQPFLPQVLQHAAPLHVVAPRDARAVRRPPRQVQCEGGARAVAAGLALREESSQTDGLPVGGGRLAHLQDMLESEGEHLVSDVLARGSELLLGDALQVAPGSDSSRRG